MLRVGPRLCSTCSACRNRTIPKPRKDIGIRIRDNPQPVLTSLSGKDQLFPTLRKRANGIVLNIMDVVVETNKILIHPHRGKTVAK